MTSIRLNPPDSAAPGGAYTHGIMTPAGGTWLHISGQIGLLPDGALASGFAGQARAALTNLAAVLKAANMDVNHLVKVTTFLLDAGDLKELVPIRTEFLGAARPASTLLVVKALAKAEWLIEIEAVAHRD